MPVSRKRRGRLSRTEKLFYWVGLRFGYARKFDGLLVCFVNADSAERDRVFGLIEGALQLIKNHDRAQYSRVLRELRCINVSTWLRTSLARANCASGTCLLSEHYVRFRATREEIATSIVHEATHIRIWSYGIDYKPELIRRIEQVCVRREIALATKLPPEELRARLILMSKTRLESCAKDSRYYSGEAFTERRRKDAVDFSKAISRDMDAMKAAGVPEWLVRGFVLLAKFIIAGSKLRQRGKA